MSVEQALAAAGYTVESLLQERQRERHYAVRDAAGTPLLARVLDAALAQDPDAYAAFMDEGRLLSGFRHPHVLDVVANGESMGVQYIVTPRFGQHLGELTGRSHPVPTALNWMLDAAMGLTALHRHGVLHRDLRPAHLLINREGRIMLAPIGVIRESTGQQVSVTSPRYMSPEQAEGSTGDGRSDLYALGVVGYELLAGQPPFPHDDPFDLAMAHINDPPPPLRGVSAEVQAVFDQLLAKSPAQRPASAEALMMALKALIDPKPVAAPVRTPAPAPAPAPPAPAPAPAPAPSAPAPAPAPAKAPLPPTAQLSVPPAPLSVVARDQAPADGALQALNRGSKANTMVMQAYKPVAKRPPWIAIVVVSMALMAATVAGLLLLKRPEAPLVPQVDASGQLAGTMGDEGAAPASAPADERLRPMLQMIQSKVERKELFPPAADNALDLLKQARQLDPENSALRVVEKTVRLNVTAAIRAEAQNNRQGIARRWVDRALEVFPEDEQLLRFRDRLDSGLPI